jgi:mono/diheme cytochrome c family protein
MRNVLILAVLVLLVIAGAFAFIYSGAYDVAATSPHSHLVQWALSTTMDRSVRSRAVRVEVPDDLSNPVRIREGAAHYVETCEGCHAGPGLEKSEIAQGLNPQAPDLAESGEEMSAQELYWVIDHGIKMTGMPAFGPTHDEREMWSMTAFVKALPTLSAAQYAELREAAEGHHHEGTGEEPEHEDDHEHQHGGGAGAP